MHEVGPRGSRATESSTTGPSRGLRDLLWTKVRGCRPPRRLLVVRRQADAGGGRRMSGTTAGVRAADLTEEELLWLHMGPFDGGLAGLIRRIRRILDVSQRGLAELLGVSQSAVARWETERTSPRVSVLQQMLSLAGVAVALHEEESGESVEPMRADGARQRNGNRYPAHVDLRVTGWWVPRVCPADDEHRLLHQQGPLTTAGATRRSTTGPARTGSGSSGCSSARPSTTRRSTSCGRRRSTSTTSGRPAGRDPGRHPSTPPDQEMPSGRRTRRSARPSQGGTGAVAFGKSGARLRCSRGR